MKGTLLQCVSIQTQYTATDICTDYYFIFNFPSCEHLWKAFNTLKYTPLQLLFNSILTIGNTKQISAHYFLRLGASGACSKMSEIYQTVVMAAIYFAARDVSRINKLIEKLARIRGRLSRWGTEGLNKLQSVKDNQSHLLHSALQRQQGSFFLSNPTAVDNAWGNHSCQSLHKINKAVLWQVSTPLKLIVCMLFINAVGILEFSFAHTFFFN